MIARINNKNIRDIQNEYLHNLEYTYTTYLYFLESIPTPQLFIGKGKLTVGKFTFREESEASSIRIELGWAFYCRFEAVLEVFITQLNIKPYPSYIQDRLNKSGVKISADHVNCLNLYREIRNTLHHGDGDASLLREPPQYLKYEEGCELHLLPDHIKKYYDFLKWLGRVLPKTLNDVI